ncbi:MAG: glycosyl hydrolase, partial [Marmoricola sp.]
MTLIVAVGLLASMLAVVVPPPAPARGDEPVCTISAKLVNSCRPWLGAESGSYGVTPFRARMLEHEARIGRQVDIVHAYNGPGAVLSPDMVTMAKRPATIALINWKPSYSWAAAGGTNATLNGQIDRMGASIKALGDTRIMFAIYHEPEDDISPGGSPSCPALTLNGSSGTTADYVNMWQNIRHRFDALGVDNVVWVMNYMGYVTGQCLTKDLWPGNDYVDWVMWDPYPKNAGWTATVGSFYNYLTTTSDAEHDYLSKPWGLGEFGYVGSSQPAAYAMYDEARRNLQNGVHPRIKAFVVWDNYTTNSHDDRVGFTETHLADPIEQQHYNAFANDPLLMGTAVPEPTDRTAPTVTLSAPEEGATVEGTARVTG